MVDFALILSMSLATRYTQIFLDGQVENRKATSWAEYEGRCIHISPSPRPLSEQHHPHCFQQDVEVQEHGHIFDVVKIVLKLFQGVFLGCAVGVVYLRPACDAWPDGMAQRIIGNLLLQNINKFRAFRPLSLLIFIPFFHDGIRRRFFFMLFPF